MMFRRKPQVRPALDQYGSFPAPTRGLNLLDSKTNMDKRDALALDNWFPEQTSIRLRRGSANHVTGFPGPVETLMEWSGGSSRKLFAASVDAIYDATTAGAVGAAVVSSLTNALLQYTQITNSAGDAFLVACNGADDVLNYDGSSWTTPTITGVTSADLINVASHKRRLWFVEKNSTRAWYMPVDSIAGAATKLDLGAVFRHGGRLQLIGTLSQDAGDGMDDYLAFFSSNGEIAVYQGTDPSSVNSWALVGVFRAGSPVGDRALLRVGGDLAMIGADGIVSVQQMLTLDRSAASKASVTNRIDPGFSSSFRLYSSNSGWQAIAYPRGHMALVNVPSSPSRSFQYVMNTQTGAWCRFTGLDARSWGLLGEELYFGSADAVCKADTGTSDRGVAIETDLKPAFQHFGSGSLQKTFKMVRPLFRSTAAINVAVSINVDYGDERPSPADAPSLAADAPLWGTMVWGAFIWSAAPTIKSWFACVGAGFVASARLYTSTDSAEVELDAIDVMFERGQRVAA